MSKRRKLQQPGFIAPMTPPGMAVPRDPSPRRTGGRSGGRFRDVVAGDISADGNVQRYGPYDPTPRPSKPPTRKPLVDGAGNLIRKGLESEKGQELVNEAGRRAGNFAAGVAAGAAQGAGNMYGNWRDERRRKKEEQPQTKPTPQAGGGNPNNTGGDDMGRGKGNGNGNGGRRGGGGGGGPAYDPGSSWDSGLQGGPYAAAPSGPRVKLITPPDPTLNKIASVPQQFYAAGESGAKANQQTRTQVNVISWNDSYMFNIPQSTTVATPIPDTVNTVIANVWQDKIAAIIQAAIEYKRGANNDINNVLTSAKLTTYHNTAIRGHALVAEINARRNFLPEYEEQNQALSLIKTKLNADTELLTMVEELKFKLSNIVLPPKVMQYCCWMYQVNKNIPETGSDVSFACSQYMLNDLLASNVQGFTNLKNEITELITLLTLTTATPTASQVTNLQYQIITQYLRNSGLPYNLMGQHVYGHPKMDYDPVWNGMWDNMALYVNDASQGRYNLFGEYKTTQDLQVAFPLSPNNVPIATTAPLIMNYGAYGTTNNRNMKRSAFPYWGLALDDSTSVTNLKNTNKWTLQLVQGAGKGVTCFSCRGSRTLFSPHIYNFGLADCSSYQFESANQNGQTASYLKQRGENIYQYNPSQQSVQDAVKRLFIEMEDRKSVV